MAARRENTPPELKDFQISCSWVPSTPAKPNSTTQTPIYENWQVNSPYQALPNHFTHPNLCVQGRLPGDYVQKTQFMGGSNSCAANFSVLEENLSNFDTWQANEAAGSHVSDKWTNLSFQNLLALADAGGNKTAAVMSALTDNSFVATSSFRAQTDGGRLESAVGYTDLAGASSSSAARFHPQIGGSQCSMSYGNSRLHGTVDLRGATFDADLDIASVLTDGSSVPSRHFFDLNSSPRTITDAVLSKSTSSHFEPITPQKANKAECQCESPAKDLSKNDVPTPNRISTDGSHLIIDQLSAATSKQLQENHKLDKGGGTEEAYLIKTPQQKARRKKHRPKVIIEGQNKSTPKPRGRKPSVPQETTGAKKRNIRRKGVTDPSGGENNGTDSIKKESSSTDTPKRKYVRKKGINKSEDNLDKEESPKTAEVNPPRFTRSSCKRSLNFDLDGQMRNESSSNCGKESRAENLSVQDQSSTVQCRQEMKKNDMAACHEFTNMEALKEKTVLGDQIARTRGKCQIVFADVTLDKEMNTVQVGMNTNGQRTPKSRNDSIACLTPERQVRGLKRQTMGTASESEFCNLNETGIFYNSMQVYLPMSSQNADKSDGMPGFLFPTIFKKKRTEKGHTTLASSSQYTAHRDSCTNQVTSVTKQGSSGANYQVTNLLTTGGTQDGRQIFEDLLALGPRKKRSKAPNRVRDLSSLLEICRELPASTSRMKGIEVLHEPPTCMEALVAETHSTMTTKKRSKRSMLINSTVQNFYNHQMSASPSMGPPLALTWRTVSPVDSIVEQLDRLDLNAKCNQASAEKQKAFMAYHSHFQEQYALVPFQKSGAVIPFDSSFDQVKRRRPRPKVDLDDETTRVWKLLLENINSEGIDGTDEEKTKRWEEERRVFNGRADSFIARMHLVQGDRRFSPWKGSVVDSVVGVFLTQNVSDHLSSSAFMSLAARFPLMSKTQPAELHEKKLGTEEVRVLDPDGTLLLKGNISNQTVCDADNEMHQDFEGDSIREVNSVNTSGNSFDEFSPKDKLGGQSPYKTVNFSGTATNKSISLIEDEKDTEDTLSSQTPEISSQNSTDSPIGQTTERSDSCLLSTLEEEPTDGIKPNRCNSSTSFVKLLQMAGTVLHGVYEEGSDKQKSGEKEISSADISDLFSECASGTTCQKITDVSFEVEPKFSSMNASSNNYYQGEIDQKIVENQAGQLPAPSLFQENCKLQEASKSPAYPQNLMDVTGSSSNIGISRNLEHKEVNSNKNDPGNHLGKTVDGAKAKGGRPRKEKEKQVDWDHLRKQTPGGGTERARTDNTMDSVDWDAVRCADVNEIAETIKERGMNNMLAERIKDFLNRLVREHGSIDLEWLRDVPPDRAKEYLLSIRGLGLKSVECVRLLTLHHLAFPVDTNVGRIAVRLGWVPLQPLPESLQLHLLELYPVLESIQKYLWPRLCKLDQRTLYELHYQMITFGKVFCTKSKPNCNACPMRGECRHFASAFASARLALPAPEEKSIVCATQDRTADQNPMRSMSTLQLTSPEADQMNAESGVSNSQPIIEEPPSPEPIIEVPSTPEAVYTQVQQCDIENAFNEDPDEIPTIQLNMEEFTQNLQKIMEQNTELQEGDMSKALVALTSQSASIPVPKLKNVSRLRTEHQVYELPDSHPLLEGMDRREPDDPCPYLLAIWTPGETANSIEPPERRCSSQEFEKLCTDETCSSCNSIREANSQTVRGTLLIPCRTAMRGSFPLNGTYFQVNEVFSDHESSLSPVDVPRKWLWNLPRRTVYFGTSIPTIFKGLSTEGIQYCFWRGFVCVRGFDRKTRAPRPLIARLHFPASKLAKGKGKMDENKT